MPRLPHSLQHSPPTLIATNLLCWRGNFTTCCSMSLFSPSLLYFSCVRHTMHLSVPEDPSHFCPSDVPLPCPPPSSRAPTRNHSQLFKSELCAPLDVRRPSCCRFDEHDIRYRSGQHLPRRRQGWTRRAGDSGGHGDHEERERHVSLLFICRSRSFSLLTLHLVPVLIRRDLSVTSAI